MNIRYFAVPFAALFIGLTACASDIDDLDDDVDESEMTGSSTDAVKSGDACAKASMDRNGQGRRVCSQSKKSVFECQRRNGSLKWAKVQTCSEDLGLCQPATKVGKETFPAGCPTAH